MILFQIVEENWSPSRNDWDSQDDWELVKIPRGLYVTPEGALRVMKELQADPSKGQYKDAFYVKVIETDDEKEVEN